MTAFTIQSFHQNALIGSFKLQSADSESQSCWVQRDWVHTHATEILLLTYED